MAALAPASPAHGSPSPRAQCFAPRYDQMGVTGLVRVAVAERELLPCPRVPRRLAAGLRREEVLEIVGVSVVRRPNGAGPSNVAVRVLSEAGGLGEARRNPGGVGDHPVRVVEEPAADSDRSARSRGGGSRPWSWPRPCPLAFRYASSDGSAFRCASSRLKAMCRRTRTGASRLARGLRSAARRSRRGCGAPSGWCACAVDVRLRHVGDASRRAAAGSRRAHRSCAVDDERGQARRRSRRAGPPATPSRGCPSASAPSRSRRSRCDAMHGELVGEAIRGERVDGSHVARRLERDGRDLRGVGERRERRHEVAPAERIHDDARQVLAAGATPRNGSATSTQAAAVLVVRVRQLVAVLRHDRRVEARRERTVARSPQAATRKRSRACSTKSTPPAKLRQRPGRTA